MAQDEIVTTRVEQIYLGRGLRGEPLEEGVVEASVDLPDLGSDLDGALLRFQVRSWRVWMPLTTVVDGAPELVWGADDSLIPTQVAVPPVEELIGFGGIGAGTVTPQPEPP